MVSRRHRARFFSKAAPPGFFPLTPRKRKAPPLRYVFLILLTLGALSGWSFWGGRMMASLNPSLRMHFHLLTPALDAWITPPDYTGLPPIMIATPAGSRYDGVVIDVPEGSTLTAHLAERDGVTPDLLMNGGKTTLSEDRDGNFEIMQPVRRGDTIAIHNGWQEIVSWRIRVIPDRAPHVALTEPPSVTDHKAVRLSYEATDDFGVAAVAARITPLASAPGAGNAPVEIALAAPDAKNLRRVNSEDLTASPWAGQPVRIQLVATDVAGHRTESAPVDFTLPERLFFNPVARALIEERVKLLKNPGDDNVRNEVANVMAGVAHVPMAYRGDVVVLMALRSGAVRLVLNRSAEADAPVYGILWEAAVRIEDGTVGIAERRLREARKELADALDRKASGPEVQGLVNRLRDALSSYLSALSMRVVRPGSAEDLSQAFGTQTNMLAPRDVERMLRNIRDLSAAGATDAAREELSKLEQRLDSLRNGGASFTDDMHRRASALDRPESARDSIQRLMQNF